MFTLNYIPKENFHNISLWEKLASGEFIYSAYAYSIDKSPDPYNVFWELRIYSTSIAELEGCEEGMLYSFIYHDEEEAEADAEALIESGVSQFDLI